MEEKDERKELGGGGGYTERIKNVYQEATKGWWNNDQKNKKTIAKKGRRVELEQGGEGEETGLSNDGRANDCWGEARNSFHNTASAPSITASSPPPSIQVAWKQNYTS